MCRCDALPLRLGGGTRHILVRKPISLYSMHRIRKVLLGILIVFLLPLAVHAALYVSKDRLEGFRYADLSSVGMLPPADATARRDSCFHRPHGPLEGHLRRPQVGGFQA
jgi:hypothetical protein